MRKIQQHLRFFTYRRLGYPLALSLTILLLGGTQLIAIGVIGEYLGRVFNETKRRPLFLVESLSLSGAAADRLDAEGPPPGLRQVVPLPLPVAMPDPVPLRRGVAGE